MIVTIVLSASLVKSTTMAKLRIGINGFGRIGRLVTRLTLDRDDMQVVAINDPNMTPEDMAYLLKYDTMQGTLPGAVVEAQGGIVIDGGEPIACYAEGLPADIPWADAQVDYVCESSGKFLDAGSVQGHLDSGAGKVILCAPPKDDTPMFVFGVNHAEYKQGSPVISNASCTTQCLAPICKVLHEAYGIKEALMTTVHATTGTQNTVDMPNKKDPRRGRAAAHNIFPTSTGSAKSVGKVIPALAGKLTGIAVRIPPTNGSLVDLNVVLERAAQYDDVMGRFKAAAQGELKGILGYTEEPLVSMDVVRDTRSGIVDGKAGLQLSGTFMKIVAWYDNELGYSARWCDLAAYAAAQDA